MRTSGVVIAVLFTLIQTLNGDWSQNYKIEVKREIDTLRARILDRWGGDPAVVQVLRIQPKAKEVLRNKFIQKILTREPLRMSFTGTSVTAGHDCYFNQSYPLAFESMMKPVFQAAGFDLRIQNTAMGNNPVYPSTWCIKTIAGEDVDIVGWEQTMMCHHSAQCIEDFIRRIHTFSPSAIPIAFNVVPKHESLKKISHVRFLMFSNHDGSEDLLETYDKLGFHAVVSLESLAVNPSLPQLSHHHLMVEDKVGSKPWHPGPHGHQLAADILAFEYLQILEDIMNEAELILPATQIELPEPLFKGTLDVPLDLNCWTTFEPKSMSNFDLALKASENQIVHSAFSDEIIFKTVEADSAGLLEPSLWNHILWPYDTRAVVRVLNESLGMLDRKYVLSGCHSSGDLMLNLDFTQEGPLILCEPKNGATGYPQRYSHLYGSAHILIDGVETEMIPTAAYPCYISPEKYSKGPHVLDVSVFTPETCIGLTHVIVP
jgi:hypothetical protein